MLILSLLNQIIIQIKSLRMKAKIIHQKFTGHLIEKAIILQKIILHYHKEVFDSNYLFCGFHQQKFEEFKKNTKIVAGTVGMVVLNFIHSYTTNKKS